jgi:hypothetical protein
LRSATRTAGKEVVQPATKGGPSAEELRSAKAACTTLINKLTKPELSLAVQDILVDKFFKELFGRRNTEIEKYEDFLAKLEDAFRI